MRHLNLSHLPQKSYGGVMRVDWTKAEGCRIPFVYDELQGEFIIREYQRGNYIVVEYQGRVKRLRSNQLFEWKVRDLLFGGESKRRSLDFSQIPRKDGRYDWVNAAGARIPFCVSGKEGTLLLKRYERIGKLGYLVVEYRGREHLIRNINLLYGKIEGVLGLGEFRYAIGEEIRGEKKHLLLLSRKREGESIVRKKYRYRCLLCGYEGWTEEGALALSAVVCSHCAGKVAMPGKTDIATEAPWMIPFFQKKDKLLIHTQRKGSSRRFVPICPNCGMVRSTSMAIATLAAQHSIACPRCGDGVSYPEKFVFALFCQLGVSLVFHPTREELPWCGRFVYDFYDPRLQTVMETNGMQHYEEVAHYSLSLAQTRENDEKKCRLALQSGIEPAHYLTLDCRYSHPAYLKQSLLRHPKLQKLYPFKEEDIDWNRCEQATITSRHWLIYRYAMEHPKMTLAQVAQEFGVCKDTARKAIRRIKGQG